MSKNSGSPGGKTGIEGFLREGARVEIPPKTL